MAKKTIHNDRDFMSSYYRESRYDIYLKQKKKEERNQTKEDILSNQGVQRLVV